MQIWQFESTSDSMSAHFRTKKQAWSGHKIACQSVVPIILILWKWGPLSEKSCNSDTGHV